MRVQSLPRGGCYLYQEKLKATDITQIARKLARLSPGCASELFVKSVTTPFQIHSLNPTPFYTFAGDNPMGYSQFLKLTKQLGQGLLKAWMVLANNQNEAIHEVAFSPQGISVDGCFRPTAGLTESLDLATRLTPAALRRIDSYIVGRNTGIYHFDSLDIPGLELKSGPTGLSHHLDGRFNCYTINGAISWEGLISIIETLVTSNGFNSLTIRKPLLAHLVDNFVISQSNEGFHFGFDLFAVDRVVKIFERVIS
ncbi:MAG: hypothetical protein KJ732_03140 [Candidatus Margulisbacteria bacterium]|nr:hypothetical protein [Candidatus Margulisiibacteriota bacterium]MBU1616850.1 hypothetical protein [Candidatus Margulisiibacteriota bacterium]